MQFRRVRVFVRRTIRQWWVVLAALMLGGVACAVFFVVRTPHYRSETLLFYAEGIRTTDDRGGTPAVDRNAPMRLREMLYSRPRLRELITRFDLYGEIRERYGMVDAIDEFRKNIDFRAPGSDTYTIAFRGTSPEQARDVTNALGASLIAEESSMRQAQAKLARDFLAQERERSEDALKRAETALAGFLAQHPSFALDTMLMMPGAPQTGAAIRAAEADHAASSAASVAPRRPRPATPGVPAATRLVPEARVPEELAAERMRAQAALAAAQTDLAQKLGRYTEQHPDVAGARATLERAQRRAEAVNAAIAAAAAGIPAEAPEMAVPTPAPPRMAAAPPPPKAPKKEKLGPEQLIALETEWSVLTRNVSEARSRYDQLEASYFRADLAASSADGGHAVQVLVLDPAYLPVKTTPPGPITWIGIFVTLSLMIGTGLAIALAAIDDRVLSELDLNGIAPALALVPAARRSFRRST
jgi:hypothetical protein